MKKQFFAAIAITLLTQTGITKSACLLESPFPFPLSTDLLVEHESQWILDIENQRIARYSLRQNLGIPILDYAMYDLSKEHNSQTGAAFQYGNIYCDFDAPLPICFFSSSDGQLRFQANVRQDCAPRQELAP